MKFLKSRVSLLDGPAPSPKPPVLEGWSESDLVSVYRSAPVRNLKQGESLFSERESTESFFVLLHGSIQVTVEWAGQQGRPGTVQRGDCVGPLPAASGLLYSSEAVEPTTVIEITPKVMGYLPANTQLCIYKVAFTSTSKINAYIRSVNGELLSKNTRLASYVAGRNTRKAISVDSERVRAFIENVPRLPEHAMDLATRLLHETTTVKEVVESLKQNPSTAGLVLRMVNSAQFGFDRKIETFYHACILLGFNNIYSLIMREALQSAVVGTEETQILHRHSCLISVLCHEISVTCKDVQGQTATTFGLLHDVGKGVQVLMKRARWLMQEHIEMLDSAKLGALLLRNWGLPERLCQIVEHQQKPEFAAPGLVPAEYRRDAGVLHIAHVLEALLLGKAVSSDLTIYTRDYMEMLGMSTGDPHDLLSRRIMPSLLRNLQRVPRDLQQILLAWDTKAISA